MIYLFIIILLLLLVFHYDYQKYTKYRLSWYIFALIIFILVAGLRYRLGIDSTRYEYGYRFTPTIAQLSTFDYESTRYGFGYLFLNAIARSVSDNFVMMQFLHAIFINSIIFWFFYKNTRHIFFAVLIYSFLYYFNFNFEVLRESCAVAVFLVAWKFFKTNSWFKYYLCSVIAILFHTSAVLMLIFPLFYLPIFRIFFKMGWTFLITAGCVFILAAVLSVKFFDYLQLLNIAAVDEYSAIYQNSDLAEGKTLNIFGIGAFLIRSLIYPLLAVALLKGSRYYKLDLNQSQDIKHKLEYMLCWYVYIAIIANFIQIFYRFNNYMIPFWTIVLADVVFSRIKLIKHRIRLSFATWMFILFPYIFINVYGYFGDDSGSGISVIRRYYPYSSVLDPYKDAKRELLFSFLGGA